jgi:hypothetical protein
MKIYPQLFDFLVTETRKCTRYYINAKRVSKEAYELKELEMDSFDTFGNRSSARTGKKQRWKVGRINKA